MVTGLSNSHGGHENQLIRDDCTRREIEEIITKVFGEEAMGFTSQNDPFDHDPFDSDDNSSEKNNMHSESGMDDSDLVLDSKCDPVPVCSSSTPDGSDIDSVLAPNSEDISYSDDFSC